MAPIPRCDLRLPYKSNTRRTSPPTVAPADVEQSAEASVTAAPKRPSLAHGAIRRPSFVDAPTKRPSLPDTSADRAPMHAERSQTRDSAEILEGADEFSTSVTRDMAEVREHELHESGAGTEDAALEGEAPPDACAVLEQCRAEAEAEAAASAAAAVTDLEDVVEPQTTVAPAIETVAAAVETVATPGDVCAHFCEERPESPSSGYDLRAVVEADKFALRRKPVKQCQGKYAPVEAYPGLWGGQKANGARKKLELEMRQKRKLYEGLHERNRKRREKERRRCKEKSRMMRCRDQDKILEAVDKIAVNKAFYLRFNYNKRLPFMPSAMDEHLQRFRKPPFKFFPKGSLPCRKQVDEFVKLRVMEVVKAGGAVTTLPPPLLKTKA